MLLVRVGATFTLLVLLARLLPTPGFVLELKPEESKCPSAEGGNCMTFTFTSFEDLKTRLSNGGDIGNFIRGQYETGAGGPRKITTTECSSTTDQNTTPAVTTAKNEVASTQTAVVTCVLKCKTSKLIRIKNSDDFLDGLKEVDALKAARQKAEDICNARNNCSITIEHHAICRNISYDCVDLENEGWILGINGLWYKFFPDKKNYDSAVSVCESYMTRLASTGIRNTTVKRSLTSLETPKAWIGLRKSDERWVWSDNVTETVTGWRTGEPNNRGGNEMCVLTVQNIVKSLNDAECDRLFPFLCEGNLGDLIKTLF